MVRETGDGEIPLNVLENKPYICPQAYHLLELPPFQRSKLLCNSTIET